MRLIRKQLLIGKGHGAYLTGLWLAGLKRFLCRLGHGNAVLLTEILNPAQPYGGIGHRHGREQDDGRDQRGPVRDCVSLASPP